jgi:excisionase family DNA binding protein
MNNEDPKKLLELSECARIVGLSVTTIRNWADTGKLRVAFLTGRGLRLIQPSDLDRVIKDRERAA